MNGITYKWDVDYFQRSLRKLKTYWFVKVAHFSNFNEFAVALWLLQDAVNTHGYSIASPVSFSPKTNVFDVLRLDTKTD